jgi:hypothetical protein
MSYTEIYFEWLLIIKVFNRASQVLVQYYEIQSSHKLCHC